MRKQLPTSAGLPDERGDPRRVQPQHDQVGLSGEVKGQSLFELIGRQDIADDPDLQPDDASEHISEYEETQTDRRQ